MLNLRLPLLLLLALPWGSVVRAAIAEESDAAPWPTLEARLADVEALLDGATRPAGPSSEPHVIPSPHAVLVFWRTENPATTWVEYGTAGALDRRTPASEPSGVSRRPTWNHYHRLRDLAPGQAYAYRLVAVGTDGVETRSEPYEVRTEPVGRALRIPEDVAGPPWVLDRRGATYRLTRDLEAPAAGIRIAAPDITLDFDGHTLVYNTEPRTWPAKTRGVKKAREVHGVFVDRGANRSARIVGGTIRQGAGNSDGSTDAIGSNPLYAVEVSDRLEIAGMEFVWGGDSVSGAFLHWRDGARVHHCVFEDRGTVVRHRHQAVSTIDGNGNHHYTDNLVRSTRQQGLIGAITATGNEVYIDSRATNSVGINLGSSKEPVRVEGNRVIGIGQHPIAFAMFGMFARGSVVADNLAIVECTREGKEYGWTGSACARTTWGAHNLHVRDNVFVGVSSTRPSGKNRVNGQTRVIWMGLPRLEAKKGAWQGTTLEADEVRGLVERNVLLALGRDDTARAGAICVVCRNASPNLIFRENLVVSSHGNVVLADAYGSSEHFSKFVGNRFRRVGEQSNYHTIRADSRFSDAQGGFLENVYEAGARAEDVKASPKTSVVFLRRFTVRVRSTEGKPLADAEVVVRDGTGAEVFRGRTGAAAAPAALVSRPGPGFAVVQPVDEGHPGYVASVALDGGTVQVVLPTAVVGPSGRETPDAYTVEVSIGERVASASLTADGPSEVVLAP